LAVALKVMAPQAEGSSTYFYLNLCKSWNSPAIQQCCWVLTTHINALDHTVICGNHCTSV